jgi:hypothetical protein
MKALLLVMLLALPVSAHPGHEPYFPNTLAAPEVDAEEYIHDYLNHGFITSYGRIEAIMGWDIESRQQRLVVPSESLNFYRHPYNQFVTTW